MACLYGKEAFVGGSIFVGGCMSGSEACKETGEAKQPRQAFECAMVVVTVEVGQHEVS